MNAFEKYLITLSVLEGKRSNFSYDPGGLTVSGLSQDTRDRNGLGDNPTQEEIRDVYQREYWQFYGCDEYEPIIAWLVCDMFVNHAVNTATVILQRALGTVKADGKYGSKTKAALANVVDIRSFMVEYADHRRGHYARRSGVLISRYTRKVDAAISAGDNATQEAAQDALDGVITQEHGLQNRLDRLFDGLWQAGLLKREPTKSAEVTQTATAAVVAGAVATVATGQASGDIITQVVEMAATGNLTATGAVTWAAGYAYNRFIKGKNILPKWAGKILGR